MANQTKLTVKTDAGTYTRKTARTYTHVVLGLGLRHEVLEARRQRDLADARKYAAQYQDAHDNGTLYNVRPAGTTGGDWDRKCQAESRAEGSYAVWAQEQREKLAQLEAKGAYTQDVDPTKGALLGWCGRLDLAGKLANTDIAREYREVRIYALDGTRVR